MQDYYSILGLTRDSSNESIKQRFKELAFEYHPDVSDKKNAQEKFIEIFEAYHVLSTPDEKTNYDLLYDKYILKTKSHVQNEEFVKSTFKDLSDSAREKAQQKSKIRYRDFIRDMDCFFIPGLKADGNPYYYNMHKTVGISGGTGPMGSIRSKTVSIPVPRSKKAAMIHLTGFIIKAIFLIIMIVVLKLHLLEDYEIWIRILVSVAILLMGGIITHLTYRLNRTKSKYFHARQYILVKKYKQKGFKRGFHPMISTTPAGIVAFILRWLF
jgi:hypothetical protein